MLLFYHFAHSAGPSCEAVSGDVACGCAGERGVCEMEVRMEKCVGTVLPHLRGKGFRITLKNWFPGVETGASGDSNFDPRGGPKTADVTRGPVLNPWFVGSGGLPGRLGLQVRLRRAV